MKRTLLFFIVLLTFAWPSLAGLTSQSLTFNDLGLGGGTASSGTYNSNDTFSFDVNLTFNGYNASSVGFWLETNTAFAGSLSITGITYGTTFPDPNSGFQNPIPFISATGASADYRSELFDLGSGITDFNNVPGPGTYFIAHITFAITNAPLGTFDIASTVTTPHTSEVTSFDGTNFADNNLPASHYSITIVPEPATLGLLGLGATGLAAVLLRRRKR